MLNWHDAEEIARQRCQATLRCLTDLERHRRELIDEMEGAGKPLRSRLAACLMSAATRLDPKTRAVEQAAPGEALFEGRLGA